MAKTVTYSFGEFMSGEYKNKKKQPSPALHAVGLGTALTFGGLHPVSAMDTTARIISAFDPIISLVQGVAYPVTFLMIGGGFLLIIMGQRSKGLSMIKWAAVGYIGLQFAPSIMQILVEVGKAMVTK
ncbi:hypothetical protein MUG87_01870 [Ectobacillus sp. JY-23]|uniref:hypothetical protein n=1 Tax=Ectobacillus sp. JY-23 TaxID=2933872 RepID=UPI001FF61EE3|nr:hypothetical protein [Ectobacillus sp. JY-23]UOY92918.1 hypothetical protein MUG87_01870 [Ectobacillus sp. JY-23]